MPLRATTAGKRPGEHVMTAGGRREPARFAISHDDMGPVSRWTDTFVTAVSHWLKR